MNRIGTKLIPTSYANALGRYIEIRAHTERLVSELTCEDQCIQSMPDASPAKWHRAHTTWFFEQFVLRRFVPDYQAFNSEFNYLFNSYYDSVGHRHPQERRGLISRPGVAQIDAYRRHVDAAMTSLLASAPYEVIALTEIGLQHEQQHQELLMTDVLDAFAGNQVVPAMVSTWKESVGTSGPTRFVSYDGGLVGIGYAGIDFSFDNEGPRHLTYLQRYQLGSRLVRNYEWLGFMGDGGYGNPLLWMADGWRACSQEKWGAPLHWRNVDGEWLQAGPDGLVPLIPEAPVRHINWYEADAYARWAGARLPTEAEWETAAGTPDLYEMTGHVWQWTSSSYGPYPGFKSAPGALGEYNAKFMVNKMVLRGGSLATPSGHTRSTYRNFFYPHQRWQFTGVRLAHDIQ